MNRFLASLFLILGTSLALADPPSGFPDIPWGATPKDAQKAMSARTDVQPVEVKPDQLTYKSGSFNGQTVNEWILDFSAGKFHTAKVVFESAERQCFHKS